MQQQQLRSLSIPSGGREVGRVIYALHAAAEIVILSLSLSLSCWLHGRPTPTPTHACSHAPTFMALSEMLFRRREAAAPPFPTSTPTFL
jgi:hypothetical protein